MFNKRYTQNVLKTFYYKWFSYPSFFNLCQTFPIKCLQNQKMFTGNNLALKNKWNNILNTGLDEKDWINILKVCFMSLRRDDIKWFQFRHIQRIFDTKAYLSKVKITQSSHCKFCSMCHETICHLLISCLKVSEFWLDLSSWLQRGQCVY